MDKRHFVVASESTHFPSACHALSDRFSEWTGSGNTALRIGLIWVTFKKLAETKFLSSFNVL